MSSVTNNTNVSKSTTVNLQAEIVDGAKQKLGSRITQVPPTKAKGRARRAAPHARQSVERKGGSAAAVSIDLQPSKPTNANLPKTTSKQDIVLSLLRLREGATIDELMEATGWQAHSVRGFLSAMVRKKLKLHLISDLVGNGIRRYRIELADRAGEGDWSADRVAIEGSLSLQDA
jgi:hypothetical protein